MCILFAVYHSLLTKYRRIEEKDNQQIGLWPLCASVVRTLHQFEICVLIRTISTSE